MEYLITTVPDRASSSPCHASLGLGVLHGHGRPFSAFATMGPSTPDHASLFPISQSAGLCGLEFPAPHAGLGPAGLVMTLSQCYGASLIILRLHSQLDDEAFDGSRQVSVAARGQVHPVRTQPQ
jgi:hypothetical protein